MQFRDGIQYAYACLFRLKQEENLRSCEALVTVLYILVSLCSSQLCVVLQHTVSCHQDVVERVQAGEVSKTSCILWCPSAEQYILVGEERWRNCLFQVV